jgi:trk system potassium uptake protein TrkA
MRRKDTEKDKVYAVIGLGRFGFALAKRLAELGKELIVVDQNEAVINDAISFTENAYIASDLSRENLRDMGIQNCDTVVVGIGGQIDISILITLTVIQLGVPHVIAKATSVEHGCVLEKLGAEVIYPERDMGIRLANHLVAPRVLEYIALSDDVNITEIKIPKGFSEQSVQQMNLRERYHLNIIAIRHVETVEIEIRPETKIFPDDIVTVVGKQEQIARFEKALQK